MSYGLIDFQRKELYLSDEIKMVGQNQNIYE